MKKQEKNTNQIPLFLGLRNAIGPRRSAFGLLALAICLCLCDLTGGSFTAPSPCPSFCPPLTPFLVLLFGGFGDFDDESAAMELLLIQSGDGLFRSLEGGKGYESIASRTSTTLDHLGR